MIRRWCTTSIPVGGLLLVALAWGFFVAASGTASAQTAIPAAAGYVNDGAQVLSPNGRARLEAALAAVDERYGVQVAIATVRTTDGESPDEYATRLYEAWKIGNAQTDRGLLLLNVIDDREVRVRTGYGMEGVLPDGRVGRILDEVVVPYLRSGQYLDAYRSGVRALLAPVLVESGRAPEELDALLMGGVPPSRQVGRRRGPDRTILIVAILILILVSRNRRRGGRLGGAFMPGGFGGLGGFGGGGFSGGGGFGGFGGGGTGGGGAGRGY